MNDAEIDEALGALSSHDVDPHRREAIRRTAHRALARGAGTGTARAWDRFVEPALVFGVSAVYLTWAFSRVATILLGS